MRISSDFRDLLYELTAARARFLIVGAYAVMFHTEPRYTKDLDIWVEPTKKNAERVRLALERFGAPVDNLSIDDLCQPEIVFQIGVEPVRVDLLTTIPGLIFATAYKNAIIATYEDIEVHLLSIRDTLRAKRAAGRPQDMIDAERLEKAIQRLKAGAGKKKTSRVRMPKTTRKR